MLQIKDTKVFSEINDFFADGNNPVFKVISFYKNLGIRLKTPGQSSYSREYKVFHLICSYLMNLDNVHQYMKMYGNWIECGKDAFYRIKSNSSISWRTLLNKTNKKIINQPKDDKAISCFLADDSTLEKSGRKMEFIGKIFDHASHRYPLGYKCLNLNYWNGKSLLGLDFSIHIEQGKNQKQGLTTKQLKERFSKTREENSPGQLRVDELKESKIAVLIKMFKNQVRRGIKAKYFLADSWFTCHELIKAVVKVSGLNYLGMAKLGKTNYEWNGKQYNAAQLIQKHRHNRMYNRKMKMYYIAIGGIFMKELPIKVFFFKANKNGQYKMLITTDTKLKAAQAYEIYKIRWSIEVFFKDCKQNLGLGKSQSTDFDVLIADTTLSIMLYNILSSLKNENEYTTIGGLFEEIDKDRLSPTLIDRITQLLNSLADVISEVFGIDLFELIEEKLSDPDFENKHLKYILKLAS